MGWGKKKDDGTGPILGTLRVLPWEREPLTEIKPLRESAALQSDLDDRGTVKGACKLSTK
jgi:hypothetical protein